MQDLLRGVGGPLLDPGSPDVAESRSHAARLSIQLPSRCQGERPPSQRNRGVLSCGLTEKSRWLQQTVQNTYLSESCISRAAAALLITPKFELPSVPLGLFQLTQLNALNASTLNWNC